MKKINKTALLRFIICIPLFFPIIMAGILLDDLTGILDYYYNIYQK